MTPTPTNPKANPTRILNGQCWEILVSGSSNAITTRPFSATAAVYQKIGTPSALTSNGRVDRYCT